MEVELAGAARSPASAVKRDNSGSRLDRCFFRSEDIGGQIPAGASLSASMNLGPHLLRRQLLDYPHLDWPADRFPALPARRAQYVLVDYAFELRERAEQRRPQHRRLLLQGFHLVADSNGFALYKKVNGATAGPQAAPPGNAAARD